MRLFTNSEELLMMAETVFIPFVIVSAQDFLQGCIYGTVKALELQKEAMFTNFVTYYVFVTPTAYLTAFYVSKDFSEIINGMDKTHRLGLYGLWLGFLVGLTHQIIAYITLLAKTDWGEAIRLVKAR